MKIVSVDEMIQIEQTANAAGLSYDMMMQNAGTGIAEWVYQNLPCASGVVGLIGSGNNGGDTLIALTSLARHGIRTFAFLAKDRGEDSLIAAYLSEGGACVDLTQAENLESLEAVLIPGIVILDGLLGTGFRLPLHGALMELIAVIQELIENRSETRIIAVDCPSGVDCDSGAVSPMTLRAEHTLTMAAVKRGLLIHPARSFAGELHLIDIGTDNCIPENNPSLPSLVDRNYAAKLLPERLETGHKGTFGTCLVIVGTEQFTGAAYLTGKAAYLSGCGLVNVATVPAVQRSLSGKLIEAVWTVLPDLEGGYDPRGVMKLAPLLKNVDSLVIGPGWGLNDTNTAFLEQLLAVLPKTLPVLFDADSLKLLNNINHWWEVVPQKSVLTPHPGEMSVLSGLSITEIEADRWEVTKACAQKWGVTLLLKGAMTVIGAPDGEMWVNPVSDAALATAGSGDVLSGVIGGLLAQGTSPTPAAVLGAWLHGQAGIIARAVVGTDASVTALNILESVSAAFVKTKEAGN